MNSALPSFPQTHIFSQTPLSLSDVQSRIESYVSLSTTTPFLHPDALLSPSGVIFSPSSGPQGNLTVSGMKKIARGLAGEDIVPDADALLELEMGILNRNSNPSINVTENAGPTSEGYTNAPQNESVARRKGVLKNMNSQSNNGGDEEGGWQDMNAYNESRHELVGEVGNRDGTDGDDIVNVDDSRVGEKRSLNDTEQEKIIKRAEKKARLKEQQLQKARKKSGN